MSQPIHFKKGCNYSGYNINTLPFVGASGSMAGISGLVPAPAISDQDKVLKGDGTWGTVGGGEANDNFRGTWEQWNTLTPAEQTQYNTRDIIGDFNGQPVDDQLSTSSMNPIQNKAVATPIEAMVNVYGSKNLFIYPYVYSASQVISGITWTDNGDGTITANGTASSESRFAICASVKYSNGGTFIANGCPANGSENTYSVRIRVGNSSDAFIRNQHDTGEGVTVSLENGQTIACSLVISSGYTANNLVFKPMFRDARIADSTFVLGAMTNTELTKNLPVMENVMDEVTINANSTNSSLSLKSGKQFSDYIFINLIAYDSNYVRGSIFTGKNPGDSGKFSGVGIITAGGVMTPFSFKQLSQTTLQIDNGASSSYKFMMRGIRRFDKS